VGVPEDGEEDKEQDGADLDDSDTDSELEAGDEEEALLRLQAELKAEEAALKKKRVAKLRLDVERRLVKVAALRAGDLVALPAEADAPIAVVTVNQTPAHSSLRPRQLAFDKSALSRKAPSAAAVAHRASVDALPDVPTVQVIVTPTVVGSGRVIAPTITTIIPAAPAAVVSTTPRGVTPPKVEKFTGDDAVQNSRVENWVEAVNRWMSLSNVAPEQYLDYALSHLPAGGSASEWVQQRKDEVAHSHKLMTWEWLQAQLIQHYSQPVGRAAMQTEWQGLRMGVRNADGANTGKATRTVAAYTNRFLYYMRALTNHSVQTTEVLVIDRYVHGIRVGYTGLYDAIMVAQRTPSPRFDTLQDAIDAAQDAEADLAIKGIVAATELSSSSSSSPGSGRFRSNRRFGSDAVNSLQGEDSYNDEGRGEDSPSPAPSKAAAKAATQLFGFRFMTLPNDGRYKLSEKEQRMLYDQRRCYRCYEGHPVGPRHPVCEKPVMKTAPKPLK
jgi:hypothetical protein